MIYISDSGILKLTEETDYFSDEISEQTIELVSD